MTSCCAGYLDSGCLALQQHCWIAAGDAAALAHNSWLREAGSGWLQPGLRMGAAWLWLLVLLGCCSKLHRQLHSSDQRSARGEAFRQIQAFTQLQLGSGSSMVAGDAVVALFYGWLGAGAVVGAFLVVSLAPERAATRHIAALQ